MATKTRLRAKAATVAVPQTPEEAAHFLGEIGAMQRLVATLDTKMNSELAALKQIYEDEAAPHVAAEKALTEGLRIWADANRAALTDNGKRQFARMSTGEIEWQRLPAKVHIGCVDKVIESIRALGLGERFLRVKVEINKAAMLNERATASEIPGVVIRSEGETFTPRPFSAEISGGAV